MSTAEMGSAGSNGDGQLAGYAECHFCRVRKKRRSWQCFRCIGRLGIRDRLVREAEEGSRRRLGVFFSLLFPGLGHAYRSSLFTGLFYVVIMSIVFGYFFLIKGGLSDGELWEMTSWQWWSEMTSGRWFLVASILLVYLGIAFDAGRKKKRELTPPCQEACPAGLSCSLYVGLTREGKFREALELVQILCPFPGTVGRVCHHPCEQNCRRGIEGEAIAICALKRYLSDEATGEVEHFYGAESGKGKQYREKVAVVGGGPSGLSAALYLHLLGFSVTVFEASDKLGGMPGAVIPDYRLPAYVYREEIERILALGIEVRKGQRLGDDFTVADLNAKGFAALYIALGAQRTVKLPHCGSPEEGFLDGIEFLRAAKKGKADRLEGHVLVIGGGNVAIDVAKTALRLGASSVRKVFLESRETMPAHHWECEEALEEGIKLIPSSATISFDMKEGRVAAALCRKVKRIDFDKAGRISPVLWEGTDFTLEADWVITAVGTGPDYGVVGGRPKVKAVKKGVRVGSIRQSGAGGMKVLIGGDYFSGPSSVIEAIAAGHEAALEIYRRLRKFFPFRLPVWSRIRPVRYPGYLDEPGKARRVHMVKVDPEVRCESFCEVCEAYDVPSAEEEAARCLRCAWPMMPLKAVRKPPAAEPKKPEEIVTPEPGKFF